MPHYECYGMCTFQLLHHTVIHNALLRALLRKTLSCVRTTHASSVPRSSERFGASRSWGVCGVLWALIFVLKFESLQLYAQDVSVKPSLVQQCLNLVLNTTVIPTLLLLA